MHGFRAVAHGAVFYIIPKLLQIFFAVDIIVHLSYGYGEVLCLDMLQCIIHNGIGSIALDIPDGIMLLLHANQVVAAIQCRMNDDIPGIQTVKGVFNGFRMNMRNIRTHQHHLVISHAKDCTEGVFHFLTQVFSMLRQENSILSQKGLKHTFFIPWGEKDIHIRAG